MLRELSGLPAEEDILTKKFKDGGRATLLISEAKCHYSFTTETLEVSCHYGFWNSYDIPQHVG